MGFFKSLAGRSVSLPLLLSIAAPTHAQVWNWHYVDFTALRTGPVDWIAHWRAEIHGTDWTQVRIGVRARFPLPRKTDWTTGYYYIRDKRSPHLWNTTHRVFAGIETSIADHGAAQFRFRSWTEYMMPDVPPNFFRFRERLLFRTTGSAGPFVSTEIFFDNQRGYRESRYNAGIHWNMGWVSAEVGYLYSSRPAPALSRHVISTGWTISRPRPAAHKGQNSKHAAHP